MVREMLVKDQTRLGCAVIILATLKVVAVAPTTKVVHVIMGVVFRCILVVAAAIIRSGCALGIYCGPCWLSDRQSLEAGGVEKDERESENDQLNSIGRPIPHVQA